MTDFWDPQDWDDGPYFYNSKLIQRYEPIKKKKMTKSALVETIKLLSFLLFGGGLIVIFFFLGMWFSL